MTHVEFLEAVRNLVLAHRDVLASDKVRIAQAIVTYGVSPRKARGECFRSRWASTDGEKVDLLHINAAQEESVTQLVGTLCHEFGHVIDPSAPPGHSAEWVRACARVGLVYAVAQGQAYAPEHFEPHFWDAVKALSPADGAPAFASLGGVQVPLVGTGGSPCCPMGWGAKGGKSRGTGSGSRWKLLECRCAPPRKVRMAGSGMDVQCLRCQAQFTPPGEEE